MVIKICRSCMNKEGNLIPLDIFFINNYNMLTNLNIKLNDKMPQYSCIKCTEIVKCFVEFREKSISSENSLWQLFMSNEEKIENNEFKIKNEIKLELSDGENSENHDTIEIIENNEFEIKNEIMLELSDGENSENHDTIEIIENNEFEIKNEIMLELSDGENSENHDTIDIIENNEFEIKNEIMLELSDGENSENHNTIEIIENNEFEIKNEIMLELSDGENSENHDTIYQTYQDFVEFEQQEGEVITESNETKEQNTMRNLRQSRKNSICTKTLETIDDLRSHLETHKTNRQCGICFEDSISWPQLFGHRITHLPYKQKKCYLCNKRCLTEHVMEFHYLTVHNDGLEKMLTCKICTKKYSNPKRYMDHKRSVHSQKKYFCDYCSKGYRIKSILQKHMIVHLDYNTFSCDQCEFTCKSNAGLQAHKIKTHCTTGARCKRCYKYFENQEKCDKHSCLKNYFDICPVCGVQLLHNTKADHLLSHEAESSYKCTRCPARLRSAAALKAHEDRHDGNRTENCESCPAKFYSRASLTKHRRIHTGERPYVCQICRKGFTANHNLKMHMRVHGQFLMVKKNQESVAE